MSINTYCIISLKRRQFIIPILRNIIRITLNVSKVIRGEHVHNVVLSWVRKKQMDIRESSLSKINKKSMRSKLQAEILAGNGISRVAT